MNTLEKTFCTVTKQRMEGLIEDSSILGEEQNDFREGRRGTDNIFTFWKIIDYKTSAPPQMSHSTVGNTTVSTKKTRRTLVK